MVSIGELIDLVFANWFILLLFGAIFVIIQLVFNSSRKKMSKPIDREEVQRIEFIDRLSLNNSEYVYLYRGNSLIGKIMKISSYSIPIKEKRKKKSTQKKKEKKGDELFSKTHKEKYETVIVGKRELVLMAVAPMLFKTQYFSMANPFSKQMAIQVTKNELDFDLFARKVTIPRTMYLDRYFGIYYDKTNEALHTTYIKDDHVIRNDIHTLASIYFAKSQEQAVFDPDRAERLALKEKDIQLEMSKRARSLSEV